MSIARLEPVGVAAPRPAHLSAHVDDLNRPDSPSVVSDLCPQLDVAVVGAGPLGLSIGAHLQAAGVPYRIFGQPMLFWRKAMPRGLRLKSEGFASSLSDPSGSFTLGRYCQEAGVPYEHVGVPVPAADFVNYGKAFQARLAPELDERTVTQIDATPQGFQLTLEGGATILARRVVLATGLEAYGHIPPELRDAPRALVSHSSDHADVDQYAGKDVVVVGAGASAADIAAGLLRSGANVRILTRRSKLYFPTALGKRSFWTKLRKPMTSIGPGWKSVLCVKLPLVFHAMPARFRNMVVRRYLGPAPAWFLASELENVVPVITSARLIGARPKGQRVELDYNQDGELRTLSADHVIAATGYRVDVERLSFLSPALRAGLRCSDGAPLLSSTFGSSVRGLYFVGAAAAPSFGPMFRFVCGSHFTARRLGVHLARTAAKAVKTPSSVKLAQVQPGPLDLINA